MKPLPLLLVALLGTVALVGCDRHASTNEVVTSTPTAGASYKAGHGLRLTPLARKFNQVTTADFSGRVPAAAVLHTVEGAFVYVENAGWLLRTPVTLSASAGPTVEITSGLYEGDRVAISGVRALWLAELHVLRAGQACAHEG